MPARPPHYSAPAGTLPVLTQIWRDLFTSRVHLDSAISKLPSSSKPVVSRLLPIVLRRPVSLASALYVPIGDGEPWSVPLEKRVSWKGARGLFVNLLPQIEKFERKSGSASDFPPEFFNEWERDWGREAAEELAATLSSDPPMSLRAGRNRGAEKLLEALREEVDFSHGGPALSDVSPVGVRVAGYAAIAESSPFREGWCEIQDEGSQFMSLFALWPDLYAKYLNEKPGAWKHAATTQPPRGRSAGLTVIDACAGAGGKSLAMADLLEGRGRAFAYDVSPVKLSALKRRALRWGFNNIQTVVVHSGEEASLEAKFGAKADRVLIDAPCSGWGVLRRSPDIKWKWDCAVGESDLPALQLRLLNGYARLAKPGGFVTFGVCTFRREETVEVVQKFLDSTTDFELVAKGFVGPGPCDGFFMAAFRRKGAPA